MVSDDPLSLLRAFEELVSNPAAKFRESVDVSINISYIGKRKGVQLKGSVNLPNGRGRSKSVAVIVGEEYREDALKSGADRVGDDDLVSEISDGVVQYDCYMTTPGKMHALAKIAKILGPKGLMPNAKHGTITTDFVERVPLIRDGRVANFRSDKNGVINSAIGMMDFTPVQLSENFHGLLAAIADAKPDDIDRMEFRSVFVSSTMGRSIKVDVKDFIDALKRRGGSSA